MNQIYWDHNATTPLYPKIRQRLYQLEEKGIFGNPSSIHWAGREARKYLNEARENVAAQFDCDESEVLFTSGGTESINFALIGLWRGRPHGCETIVSSPLEHPATLKTLHFLERLGARLIWLQHDSQGRLDLAHLEQLVQQRPWLVSLMAANNELGNLNPIESIAELCQNHQVLFHCDATQWVGKLPLDLKKIPIDLLSFSSHKFHGPKGAGALIARAGIRLLPFHHGGGQERSLRAGTQNLFGIYGMALALEEAQGTWRENQVVVSNLRKQFEERLFKQLTGVQINGDVDCRLFNTVNLSFDGVDTQTLLMNLDLQGVAASSGSACESGSIEPSHVLMALQLPLERVRSSIRFSFSSMNTESEIEVGSEILIQTIQRLRSC